jgi:hypothetical protein
MASICPTALSSSSTSNNNNNSIAVGAGVGIPLGVLFLLSLAWALWERKKASTIKRKYEYGQVVEAPNGWAENKPAAELEATPMEMDGTPVEAK